MKMMHEFLSSHREELIARCLVKVAKRDSPPTNPAEAEHGIPLFLDQLIRTLRLNSNPRGYSSEDSPLTGTKCRHPRSELDETASRHGRELMARGFTVEQVVHDYGDLCQAITELAFEVKAPIEVDEFRILNRCLR